MRKQLNLNSRVFSEPLEMPFPKKPYQSVATEHALSNITTFDSRFNGRLGNICMLKGKKDPIAAHGAILVTDVDRFGRAERSDVDRTEIRAKLQNLLKTSLKHCLPSQEKEVGSIDTGDGVGLVFPADTPKVSLLNKLLPLLQRLVRDHNHHATDETKILVRAVLHFGEYFKDQPELTKAGFTGNEINCAFRLLNSALLRKAVRGQGELRPLAFLLSHKYYTEIVLQQIPILKNEYISQTLKTKDSRLPAWLHVFRSTERPKNQRSLNKSRPHSDGRKRSVDRSTKQHKQPKVLSDLPPASIFISASDIHNFNLYKRIHGSVPLVNHLETALLLSDHAIIHCTDPYRSPLVLDLLTEFHDFVTNGSILFLLGSSIQTPKKDFIFYIASKAAQYRESGLGEADINSLNLSASEAEPEGVLQILEDSPYLLHRGYKGTDAFVQAVKNDFAQTEVLATSYSPLLGKLSHVNLTLRQILCLCQIGTDGTTIPLVAAKEQTESIINELNRRIDHHSFSRQILLSLVREALKGRNVDQAYFDLLEIRTNLLHLRINVGPHTFTEFHPQRERNSPYDYAYLLEHLATLSNRAPKERCGVELVKTLRRQRQWRAFAAHHLRVMADLYSRRLGDLEIAPNGFFIQSRQVPEFRRISNIVNDHWT
jgi:hypothetical protein